MSFLAAIVPSSPLQPAAAVYFVVFGVVTIAGGIMGYVKARSVASLKAGSVSGALLVFGGYLLRPYPWAHLPGILLTLLVSLALLGRFLPALLRGKPMPAVFMAPLAGVGALLALYLLVSLIVPRF